jgi:predicted nucleic acid-binding Zn ribbon protein
MKPKQKAALIIKMRLGANLSQLGQQQQSLKAMIAANLPTNPIEKRNWSIHYQTG